MEGAARSAAAIHAPHPGVAGAEGVGARVTAVAGSPARNVPSPAWFRSSGPELDVVVSTRCRYARNLDHTPFPHLASSASRAEVVRLCARAVLDVEPRSVRFDRPGLDADTFRSLVLGRYVSFRWAETDCDGSSHVAADGLSSIMVNEEDHVRVQTVIAGFDPEGALRPASELCGALARRLPFAHSPGIGFLTASLANVGSGMRLGFLLHLPALAESPTYLSALAAAESMGCSVRGAFGEGTAGTGALIQLSNRCTYGEASSRSAERAVSAAYHLAEREREARGRLLARPSGRSDLRAAATGARDRLLGEDLSPGEALRCVSVLRLGIGLGATNGDLVRTGEWLALAGVQAWARRHGGLAAQRFESVRSMAAIRADLRRAA